MNRTEPSHSLGAPGRIHNPGRIARAGSPFVMMGILLVLWGSFAAGSKFALRSMDNYQLQFYMFGAAAAVMTVSLLVTGRIRLLRGLGRREWGRLALYGAPSYLYYLCYISALERVPAIEASMLNYLFPLFIVLLAVPFHGEKLHARQAIGLLAGFAGTAIIVTGGDFTALRLTNAVGDLLAIAGAISWALFSNLGRKNRIAHDISNYVYTLVAFGLSALCLPIFSSFAVPDAAGLSWTIWLALSNVVLTYPLWFRVLQSASSSLVASLSFLTPFVTLLFIVFLLDERLTVPQLAGFACIVAGIAVQLAVGRKSSG